MPLSAMVHKKCIPLSPKTMNDKISFFFSFYVNKLMKYYYS